MDNELLDKLELLAGGQWYDYDTKEEARKLILNDRHHHIALAENRGKIEAIKYAMQFAEKDPGYVTWDFLDGMLTEIKKSMESGEVI